MSIETLTPYRKILQLQPDDIKRRLEDPNDFLPKHLLMSALSEKLALKKGAQQPVDSETVRDLLVAQATPQPAGIAGMMPQQSMQRFSDGSPGGVRSWIDNLPEGAFLRTILEHNRKFERNAENRELGSEQRYPSVIPTQATTPTMRLGDYSNEHLRKIPPKTEAPAVVAATAPAKSAGIATTAARNPFKEYGTYGVKPKDLSTIPGMNAPKNAQLDEEIANITKQLNPKIEQLAREKEAAGLTAFGASMLAPGRRGFGAAFAPAAKESVGAMQEKDKEARTLQMRYEDIARDLGLKKGTDEYNRFVKDVEFRQAERAADLSAQERAQSRADTVVTEGNKIEIEKLKVQVMAEANAIQRDIRRDGLNNQHFDRLMAVRNNAYMAAVKAAEDRYSGPMFATRKDLPGLKAAETNRVFNDLFPEDLQAALNTAVGHNLSKGKSGITTLPSTQPTVPQRVIPTGR